ncbi:sigma-70 family RNA polymerase sigma factor [Sorangium atrum]|uniref:Sigma-70 family RNA polymerase sigma factor n=1 Tax=Sorangium atrum TaxID=2995308 RepID=A0ABT5CC76_9BACT|nr:sigma-70 family RNA polymerase sigma factor [Sorangium aterium]MDC0684039.1 sigma-70 family RNA polymerase sigma factor [Sorangium aterium]
MASDEGARGRGAPTHVDADRGRGAPAHGDAARGRGAPAHGDADRGRGAPTHAGAELERASAAPLEAGEAQFIARLVARDESAFNELVIMYERRVFALVYRMLGRRDEAEDVSQEVFVQVFKAIDQFRGESKLSTWIYRIAVNLCKNRTKYLSRRHAGAQDDVDAMAERVPLSAAKGVSVGDVSRPDELVEGMQLEAVVKRAIGQLDPEFREALILRDVEDMSYEEIASVTGLPDGTVKSRIHRARGQLRALVEKMMGEKVRGGK